MNLLLLGKKILPLLALFFYVTVAVADDKYDLIVTKSRQELDVVRGNQVIKHYHIAYGKGGNGPKRMAGDSKTPLGVYKIIDFRNNSNFYFFMQLDYPNLLDAWYGYKNNIISATEFKRIANAYKSRQAPPQDTKLGGNIGIHGLGTVTPERLNIHEVFNWTNGCIALTNDQINDLKQYVSIGTKVVIRE
jgi:murein L,D-transpeptidase YafK